MAIVLASQSPRRQELLARIGVEDFKTLSLDFDESYPEGLSPEDTGRYIAKKKCDAAAALCAPDDLIITADTMVFLGNDRLGKPRDEEDALRILRLYRFAARFGFAIDPATGAAARALGPHLDCVSAERIQEELLKLLAAPRPGSYLEPAVLAVVLPELEPAAEPAHPVDESRGHCGVGLAVVPHHRVHHLAGSGPEVERLFSQRNLLLAA